MKSDKKKNCGVSRTFLLGALSGLMTAGVGFYFLRKAKKSVPRTKKSEHGNDQEKKKNFCDCSP